jgi:hypothetical protein
MKLVTKGAIAMIAAAALTLSGVGLAMASTRTPPTVPDSLHRAAGAKINAIGNSPRPPASIETTQVAVTPCSIFDTSKHGGRILNGHSRTVLTRGAVSFASQGGSSSGCGVPDTATSVIVVITAASTTKSGHLSWQRANLSKASRILSYTKGQTMTLTTTLAAPRTEPSGSLKNSGGSVSVSMSVIGYTIPQIAGMLDGTNDAVYSGSTRILGVTTDSVGTYTVTVDSDVSYCTPVVTAYSGDVYASAYGFSGDQIHVSTWYLNSSTHVETPFTGYFYLVVDC